MVVEKLCQFAESKGITITEFERKTGLSQGLLLKARKANSSIGSDKLENILSIYPELDMNWLFKKENTQTGNTQNISRNQKPIVAGRDNFFTSENMSIVSELLSSKDVLIAEFRKEVEYLRENNKILMEMVSKSN